MDVLKHLPRPELRLLVLDPPPVVLVRLGHHLRQPLGHGGRPAVELDHLTVQRLVPEVPLGLHQVDIDRHDVGKVLTVRGRHVDHPVLEWHAAEVAFGAENTGRLVEIEASVRVPRDDPVGDDVPGVEVEGREREDLPAQRQGPGHLARAPDTLKLK